MKIRFYHMWVYRLFYRVWSPILKTRPDIVAAMHAYTQDWIDQEAKLVQERRDTFTVVK